MKKLIASLILRVIGWKPGGQRPEYDKYVLVAAPHTSNWDLVLLITFALYFGVRVNWIGKQSIFRPPFGRLMRALGGVPIDRTKRQNFVEQMVEEFEKRDRLVLTVPAEGTRSYRDYWKSGFYYIAKEAGVPIILGFLDYENKRGGFRAKPVFPSDDLRADMDEIRSFYQGMKGKFPDQFSRVRLRGEEPVDESDSADPAEDAQGARDEAQATTKERVE